MIKAGLSEAGSDIDFQQFCEDISGFGYCKNVFEFELIL